MDAGRNLFRQNRLRPAESFDSPDIPRLFFKRQARFEYYRILRPADFHCFPHDFRSVFVGTEKVPHPTDVAR